MKALLKKIIFLIFISNFLTLINCSNKMDILFHEKEAIVDVASAVEYGSLSGKVYDVYLNKIEGAEITLSDNNGKFSDNFSTDSQGKFSFSSIPEGNGVYSVNIVKTGYNTESTNNISVMADANNDLGIIYIQSSSVSPGTINGTLVDAIDGTTIEGAQINIIKFDNTTAGTLTTGVDGNFTTSTFDPGSYFISITKPGYVNLDIDVDVDGNIDLGNIGFYPTVVNNGSLTGKILDSFKNEISGAIITITNSAGFISETTTTNALGNFSFSSLSEGMNIYTITVEKSGFNTSIKNNISVVAGTETDVGIIYLVSTDATPGTITGRVIDANDGANVAGATVKIIKYDDTIADTKTSDSNGNFITSVLDPGSYTVIVSKPDYYDLVVDNRIVNGDTDIYNLAICGYLTGNQLRVYVLWAEHPLDLDLHVVGPTSNADTSNPLWDGSPDDRFHTYYMLNWYDELIGVYNADSDDDGTSAMVQDANIGVGPETINFGGAYEYGTYTFTIFNFSKTDWDGGKYMPVLRVYDSQGLVQEVPFPSKAPGPDEWYWKVFKMDIYGPSREDRTISIPTSGHYMNYSGMEFMDKSSMDW